ncbi:MAG: class I SAM-dependent methyltransferase [Candidatus Shapirobacteria bacterium]
MKKIIAKNTRDLLKKRKLNLVDIGCGGAKQGKNWFGIDYRKMPGVDLVQDLEKFPWAIPSESFDTAVASHVVEHINPSHGIFISFMNEAWRILKPGGEFIIAAPYATSIGMFRDPTHVNFINEETWSYFDPQDNFYNGGLYNVYNPLPWKVKVNTWHSTGNIEVVLVKREIKPEYKVDSEHLRLLKKHTKLTK